MRLKMIGLGAAVLTALVVLPARGQNVSMNHAIGSAANAGGASSGDTNRPELQHRPRYTIKKSDILILSFPVAPEYNQTIAVQPDGYISLLGGGSVHVEGLDMDETRDAIRDAYNKAKVLKDAIVTVDVKDFQKPYFTVSGQVGKPGQYELRYDTTLTEALAVAGGLSSTSTQQAFLFHRESEGWFQVTKINLKQILNGKNTAEDPHLQPGDMVFVPENFITKFRKYVPYTLGVYYNPAATLP